MEGMRQKETLLAPVGVSGGVLRRFSFFFFQSLVIIHLDVIFVPPSSLSFCQHFHFIPLCYLVCERALSLLVSSLQCSFTSPPIFALRLSSLVIHPPLLFFSYSAGALDGLLELGERLKVLDHGCVGVSVSKGRKQVKERWRDREVEENGQMK